VSGIVSAAEIRSGTPSEANRGRAAAKGNKGKEELFRHVGTFDVMHGNGSSVAEIVDATKNGNQLVYTDGPNEEIGFVDISDPSQPSADGTVDVGGQPTSLVVLDPLILVGVNTPRPISRIPPGNSWSSTATTGASSPRTSSGASRTPSRWLRIASVPRS
jgi:hypothetical protein